MRITEMQKCKNKDYKNCLNSVYAKYALSQLVSNVNSSSQISQTEGFIYWGRGEWGVCYVSIEDL